MMKTYLVIFLTLSVLLLAGCTSKPSDNDTKNQTRSCSGAVCGTDNKTYESDCKAQDAKVQILHLGECATKNNTTVNNTTNQNNVTQPIPIQTCVDPDGENASFKSTTSIEPNGTVKTDYCKDNQNLMEMTCQNKSIVEKLIQCSGGQICQNGACTLGTASCIGPSSSNSSVRLNISYNGSFYSDYCADLKSTVKYFCTNGTLNSINTQCDSGEICNLGVCQADKSKCTETDGGKDVSVRGKTTSYRTTTIISEYTDECIDEGKVKEYFCLSDGITSKEDIICPSGFKCANGACSILSLCTKSDRTTKVTHTDSSGKRTTSTYDDRCRTNQTLEQYYCYGDSAESKLIDCHCEDGLCLKN